MNISLPATLNVRDLIRKELDRQELRSLLLAGGASATTEPVAAEYFASLRKWVHKTAAKGQP